MLPSLVPRDSAGMARPLTIAKSGASALASISAPRCPATVVASRGSSPTMVMRPSSFGASENRSQTRSLRLSARAILLAAAATTESTRLKLFRPPGWPQPKHKLVVKRALVGVIFLATPIHPEARVSPAASAIDPARFEIQRFSPFLHWLPIKPVACSRR